MVTLSTEDFPYTVGYVKELLNVEEHVLMSYVQALSLSPKVDERTGAQIFTHRDVELLRKALEMKERSSGMTMISKPAEATARPKPQQPPPDALGAPLTGPELSGAQGESYASQPSVPTTYPGAQQTGISSPRQGGVPVTGKDNLAMIVEAVSQAKEGILKDLSRLLDDKLAGLDEVVVELIRCKSENDSLKQKLNTALEESRHLQEELSKFKPVQFGFYRKTP